MYFSIISRLEFLNFTLIIFLIKITKNLMQKNVRKNFYKNKKICTFLKFLCKLYIWGLDKVCIANVILADMCWQPCG